MTGFNLLLVLTIASLGLVHQVVESVVVTPARTRGISKYAAKVNALIDAETCDPVVTDADRCLDDADADSYYETYVYKGNRIIIASGTPDHPAEEKADLLIPEGQLRTALRCTRWQFAILPLNPSIDRTTYTLYDLGVTGYVESGAVVFTPQWLPEGNLIAYDLVDTLDNCWGHSNNGNQYHYHGIPVCLPDNTFLADDASVCYQVGWMMDGFPVYGRCNGPDGKELVSCYYLREGEVGDNIDQYEFDQEAYDNGTCFLDRANGYVFPDGHYGIILTMNFSTTPTGTHGTEIGQICGFTP